MNPTEEVEIVLVEDNPSDAELIIRALRKHHLANKIIHLKDGAEALEFLHGMAHGGSAPTVVLLDINLPRVDGLEVLRRLRDEERTRQVPVVVLTSSGQDRDIEAAYKLGANSFVTKPVRFDDFARMTAELGLSWMMLNAPPMH